MLDILQYSYEVLFCSLVVPQIEENFCEAELCLDVLWIVFQTLLVVLKSLIKSLLDMLNFA